MDIIRMREAVRKLNLLMDDPQPGLMTWNQFFREATEELNKAVYGIYYGICWNCRDRS